MISFDNLAAKGVRQNGSPDISTLYHVRYDLLVRYALVCHDLGLDCGWLKLDGHFQHNIISGYREYKTVNNSPHCFAAALDVQVSHLSAKEPQNRGLILDEQIRYGEVALSRGFERVGLYPEQNTCHLDILPESWQKEYNGTKFWVKYLGEYTGFNIWSEAISFAKSQLLKRRIYT